MTSLPRLARSSAMRHLVLAVPLYGLGLAACEGCRSSSGPGTAVPSGYSDPGPPTVRLILASDVAGALEPCGCTKDQLGGMNHLGAWVSQNPGHVPASVFASVGPLFYMNDKADPDRADQDKAKADTIARVLRRMNFGAFAPGTNDWVDGPGELAKRAAASGATAIVAATPPSPDIASMAVREYGGLKVGFVGYGQPAAPGNLLAADVVRAGVAEARKLGANVLVALAAVGRGEAKRIADAVPELTAVVVGSVKANGDGNTTAPQGEQVGDVLVVQAANHLQSVAVLDLYVREPVEPAHLIKFADATGLEQSARREELARQIDDLHVKIAAWQRDPTIAPADIDARRKDLARLEAEREALDAKRPPAKGSFFRYAIKEVRESLGTDPGIESEMLTYYKAVDDRNRAAFAGRMPPAAAPDGAHYLGVDACTTCHEGPRKVWNGTPHAHAYATLANQFKEFNLDCVSCHVTGYDRPGGSSVTHVAGLTDVQCENCHGPGSKHAAKPTDKSLIVGNPDPSMCLGCHHPPHVEQFDPAIKMREILGPGHGMPAK
jgi:hypothetical protein